MGRRSKVSSLPTCWPEDGLVVYLASPVYSKHLTETQKAVIRALPAKDAAVESSSRVPPVEIRLINDGSHPAHGQRGLFATRDLGPSVFILFYIGYLHNDVDNDPNSDYDLSMDREAGLAIDATKMGNEARFVNDYRGVPGRDRRGPNAEFKDCWTKIDGKWERRVGVYVLPVGNAGKRKDGIKSGEEILVSYGKGFWCKAAGKQNSPEYVDLPDQG